MGDIAIHRSFRGEQRRKDMKEDVVRGVTH